MALEFRRRRQRHLEQLELVGWVEEGEVKPRGNNKGIGFPEAYITLPCCVKCHAAFKQEEGVIYNARDMAVVRGRMGGTGSAFNLGEMTVTRCALRLATGEVGHGYVQGRDKAHAERAALVDALMQTDRAEAVQAQVLDPLAEAALTAKATRAAKAAATKVDFFTMVRGED